jgi:hypothetical protein
LAKAGNENPGFITFRSEKNSGIQAPSTCEPGQVIFVADHLSIATARIDTAHPAANRVAANIRRLFALR